MATKPARKQRGNIELRSGGSYRVRVYAGVDPISKKAVYLKETVPAGPKAEREAEKVLTRLLNQVDERRAPRTTATVDQLLDRYFEIGIDVEPDTKNDYVSKARKHIRPILGSTPIAKVEAQTLEGLYADLRRCSEHCDGRSYVQHRTDRRHVCDEHGQAGPCSPFEPSCRKCTRMCKPHECKPYKASGVRAVHYILSGALGSAVRWGWLSTNPAQNVKKPAAPVARPRPPSVEDAARLVNDAFRRGPGWGVFIWTAMRTGARRGELCGLHWTHLELDNSLMRIECVIARDENGNWYEKDTTKSEHDRRVVLDEDTVALLQEHRAFATAEAAKLGIELDPSGYVFSPAPDHSSFLKPGTATHRFDRMAARLGINSTLHKLRHYSATELINAGVDIRAVAGRLGHGSGGATTLRVYTAWLAEADQRAAMALVGRMPERPESLVPARPALSERPPVDDEAMRPAPYVEIARDLRGAIRCGVLKSGDLLPPEKELAGRYGVAASTAHRAIAQLASDGVIRVSRGRRPVVIDRHATSVGGDIPRGGPHT